MLLVVLAVALLVAFLIKQKYIFEDCYEFAKNASNGNIYEIRRLIGLDDFCTKMVNYNIIFSGHFDRWH